VFGVRDVVSSNIPHTEHSLIQRPIKLLLLHLFGHLYYSPILITSSPYPNCPLLVIYLRQSQISEWYISKHKDFLRMFSTQHSQLVAS